MQDNDQQGRGGKKGKKPGKSQSQVQSQQQQQQQDQQQQQQRQQQKEELEAAPVATSASSSVASPPDKESQDKELSSDPSTQAVIKRWRKYNKKAESIRQTHEKQGEGVELNEDQKALLAQEVEVLAILDELNQIKAELDSDSPKEQLNKRIRKFGKKAKTIEGIKQKQAEGIEINEDQKKCLAGEGELQAVLAELTSLQIQLEKECPQVFGTEACGNNSQQGS